MNPYLIIGLETSAKLFEELVKSFPQSQYDVRPDPKRFSMREVVAHLSDWEPIFLERLKLAVNSPGSTITVYDEGEFAKQNNYAAKNPVECVDKFIQDRIETIEYLKGLSANSFQNAITHPERGAMRMIDVAHTMVCHDLNHIEQLRVMRNR